MSKKLIIIIAILLPVLGGGGYFGYSMFLAAPGGKSVSPAAAQKLALKKLRTEMKLRVEQRIEGPIVPLGDDFIVNLNGLAHFAKFDVSLKVDKQTTLAAGAGATAAAALEDQAQIRDIVIADTSSYSAAQLATMVGKHKLKERIMTDVSDKTNTVALDVYFTGFAIQ